MGGFLGRFKDLDVGDWFESDFFGFGGFMAEDGGGMVVEVVEITISSSFCSGDDGGRELEWGFLFGGGGDGNGRGSGYRSSGSLGAGGVT